MSSHPFAFAFVAAAAPLAADAVTPPPAGTSEIVQWLVRLLAPAFGTACVFAVTKVAPRFLAGRAAKKRSLAASKERRARQLLTDGDKANDKEGHRLEDEADALRAEADESDAISGNVQLGAAALDEAREAMKKHGAK